MQLEIGIDAQRGESPPRDNMTEFVLSHDSILALGVG